MSTLNERAKSDGLLLSNGEIIDVIPPSASTTSRGGIIADPIPEGEESKYKKEYIKIASDDKLSVYNFSKDIETKFDKTDADELEERIENLENATKDLDEKTFNKYFKNENGVIKLADGNTMEVIANRNSYGGIKAEETSQYGDRSERIAIGTDGFLYSKSYASELSGKADKSDVTNLSEQLKELNEQLGDKENGGIPTDKLLALLNAFEVGNNVIKINDKYSFETAKQDLIVDYGYFYYDSIPAGKHKDFKVDFNVQFPDIPNVVVCIYGDSNGGAYGGLSAVVLAKSITKTGFTVRIHNNLYSDRWPGYMWQAVYKP